MYINLCFVMKQISLLEGVSFLYLFADVKKKARISNDRRGKKNCSFALCLLLLNRLVHAALIPSPKANFCPQQTLPLDLLR